jgi:predicted phosphoribosyltransferase
MFFPDRADAGRQLAAKLTRYANRHDVVVLALPRGGVPVAYEVARALAAPLDVFLVRKLGVPGYEELAMGAIASGGVRVLNEEAVEGLGIPPEVVDQAVKRELREMERRELEYRDGLPAPVVRGRIVILVDDGLATGSTMRAAVASLRKQAPSRIVVAVPVGAPETCASIRNLADEVVRVLEPERFRAVGLWYDDFSQTTDEEVRHLLHHAAEVTAPGQ